jgi:hypothetical protein
VRVTGVEFRSACISINSIRDLVVAALVKRTKIEPHFGDIRVNANSAGVSVEGVPELVDVIV